MQIQSTETEYCKLEIFYTADKDVVKEKRNQVISELKHVQMPGFRKGKVPENILRAKFGSQIDVYTAEKMKAQAFDDAVFETEAKAIGYPKFEHVDINGDSFSCKMTIMKAPEFEIKDFSSYEIPSPILIDVDAEVEKAVLELRERFGGVRPYDDNEFVENGDQLTISFNATIDGQPFEGSVAEGQLYFVGHNSIKQFDDNILGMQPGDSRTFEVLIPETFDTIGGKVALFNVVLHMGTKKTPANLDDDFARQCGEPSVDSLRDKLKKIAELRQKQKKLMDIRQQLSLKLLNDNQFKCPEFLVNLEAQNVAMQNGIDFNSLTDEEKQAFLEQAEKAVRLSLILNKVREVAPDSALSEMDAQNALIQRAQAQGHDPQQFFIESQKNGSLLGMLSAMKDEYTIQFLIEKVKIVD